MANDPSIAEVQWKEPPPFVRGPRTRGKWAKIADQLRAQPGRWALVAENVARCTASNIQRGIYPDMPKGQFEATNRQNGYEGRGADIYARYIGGDS